MDFNADDFIAAVENGQPYSAGGVEVRFREPGLTRVQLITIDGRQLGFVSPAVVGEGAERSEAQAQPGLTVHWTLNGHDIPRAAALINALGNGLLGRPLVRLVDGKPHRVRFDGLFWWNEEIKVEEWVRASNVYGAEA